MFDTLISYWREYKTATITLPYNPDRVQALGMRFCQEWKARRKEICELFDIPDLDFEYVLHHTLMPKIAASQ